MAKKRIINECDYFENRNTYKNFLFRLSNLSVRQCSQVIKSRNFPPDIARQISEEVKYIVQRRKEREKRIGVRQDRPQEERRAEAETSNISMTPIGSEVDKRKEEQWKQRLAALEEELDGYEEQMRAGIFAVPFRVINDMRYQIAVLREKLKPKKQDYIK